METNDMPYVVYAHYFSLATAINLVLFGLYSILWTYSKGLVLQPDRFFIWTEDWVGAYSIVLAFIIVVLQCYYYGLYRPLHLPLVTFFITIFYFVSSIPCFFGYPTLFPGFLLLTVSILNFLAMRNREFGDVREEFVDKSKNKNENKADSQQGNSNTNGNISSSGSSASATAAESRQPILALSVDGHADLQGTDVPLPPPTTPNPNKVKYTTWMRWKEKGILQKNIILGIWIFINIVLALESFFKWRSIVDEQQIVCHQNKPCLTDYAPAAKMFGQLLNFNCALVFIPVTRFLILWANNYQISPQNSLENIIPIRYHISFHKLIAYSIIFFTFGHVTFHFVNMGLAPRATIDIFGYYPWYTGAVILFALICIASGAIQHVKHLHYELFRDTHKMYIIFTLFLFAHAPNFYAWCIIPACLLIWDIISQDWKKLKSSFYIKSVRYYPPVMEITLFPQPSISKSTSDKLKQNKFNFKEGQYMYLMCPTVSHNESHPFTISSAYDDLDQKNEITLHIKVHDTPKSWTYNVMKYFKQKSDDYYKKLSIPQDPNSENARVGAFVVEFTHMDSYGDSVPGAIYDDTTGIPLLTIEGPHAAPAQHYNEYKDVMMVATGVGITPTASIIKALSRYKWRKGFNTPQRVRVYWLIKHSEVLSFRWFIELVSDTLKIVGRDMQAGTVDHQNHLMEFHIFVSGYKGRSGDVEVASGSATGIELTSMEDNRVSIIKDKLRSQISSSSSHFVNQNDDSRSTSPYNADAIEEEMIHPRLAPDNFFNYMRSNHASSSTSTAVNGVWIWNGKPEWDQIFEYVKTENEDRYKEPDAKIGVLFCGPLSIGDDLKMHCRKHSKLNKIRFALHKENF